MLFIVGAVHQAATSRVERVLQQRGITTSAHVVGSTYDPGAGDPNGFTTDTVQFRVADGHTQRAVVGHHGDDHHEQASGITGIVYDPEHPAVVMSVEALADSLPGLDLVVAIGGATMVNLAALALLLSSLQISIRPHRERPTPP